MGVQIPRMESCCCGCTIRNGTLIILWIYLFISIFSPIMEITNGGSKHDTDSGNATNTTKFQEINTTMVQIQFRTPNVFNLIEGMIAVFIAGLGLYGVYKEIAAYLLPFIVIDAILMIRDFIPYLILGNFFVILAGLVILLGNAYFWMVIYNHYRNIKDGNSSLVA